MVEYSLVRMLPRFLILDHSRRPCLSQHASQSAPVRYLDHRANWSGNGSESPGGLVVQNAT